MGTHPLVVLQPVLVGAPEVELLEPADAEGLRQLALVPGLVGEESLEDRASRVDLDGPAVVRARSHRSACRSSIGPGSPRRWRRWRPGHRRAHRPSVGGRGRPPSRSPPSHPRTASSRCPARRRPRTASRRASRRCDRSPPRWAGAREPVEWPAPHRSWRRCGREAGGCTAATCGRRVGWRRRHHPSMVRNDSCRMLSSMTCRMVA